MPLVGADGQAVVLSCVSGDSAEGPAALEA